MEIANSPPKSARRKKKAGNTPRGPADGNSVVKKPKPQVLVSAATKKKIKTPKKQSVSEDVEDGDISTNSQKKKSKGKKLKEASDFNGFDSNESLRNADDEADETEVEHRKMKPKKKEKKLKESVRQRMKERISSHLDEHMETDVSFEQAVEKARGIPDGGVHESVNQGPMNSTEIGAVDDEDMEVDNAQDEDEGESDEEQPKKDKGKKKSNVSG